jgi:general secretion pathway protein K
MVMLMSILLLGFNQNSRAAIRTANNFKNNRHALNCARTSLNIAIAAIRDNNDIYTNKILREMFSGQEVLDIDGAACSVKVVDENSKLNLNTLTSHTGILNRTAIDQLLLLIDIINANRTNEPRIRYAIAPAIIDWIDIDNQVVALPFIKNDNLGAESTYYNSLPQSYNCRNAPLDTINDILNVKGMTKQIFNSIRNHITVYGDGKININTATIETIQSLSHEIDPALAALIVDRREFKPFESFDQIKALPAVTDTIYKAIRDKTVISSENQYYRVNSRAKIDEITAEITVVLRKNINNKSIDILLYQEL